MIFPKESQLFALYKVACRFAGTAPKREFVRIHVQFKPEKQLFYRAWIKQHFENVHRISHRIEEVHDLVARTFIQETGVTPEGVIMRLTSIDPTFSKVYEGYGGKYDILLDGVPKS